MSAAGGVVAPIAIASTVTPADLAALIASPSFVFVVSSPSVRTTSTFVSVGASRARSTGLDHGVVERRALDRVERARWSERRRARPCRCRARAPDWPCARRSRCAIESALRLALTKAAAASWRAASGRALHRAADVERDADRGRRAAARLGRGRRAVPFSLSSSGTFLSLSLLGRDHGRRDERIARRVDLRDPHARRRRAGGADGDGEHGREAGRRSASARLMPRPSRTPSGAVRRCRRARSGSSWKNCGGRCTPFSPSLERNCGLMPTPSSGRAGGCSSPPRPRRRPRRAWRRRDPAASTTSDSMRSTSVMCVMRRVPSTRRETCTTMSKADAICSRIALSGSSTPPVRTSVSTREQRVARGVRVDRRQRAVMARVHGLEHVDRLGGHDTRRR